MPKLDHDIGKFLRNEIKAIPHEIYGPRYRVAAYLKDGTYLPCVVLQSKKKTTELALKRFEELKEKKSQYEMVVETFVAEGNSVAPYNIQEIEVSPYAWPQEMTNKIKSETTMGWTCFVAEMNDGKKFNFGTNFSLRFFDHPENYSYKDIKKIHTGKVYLETEEMVPYRSLRQKPDIKFYNEKPFFVCYSEYLDND